MPNDGSGTQLIEKARIIATTINADPGSLQISSQPRGGEMPISALKGRSLKSLGLNHGDLLFLTYKSQDSEDAQIAAPVAPPAASQTQVQPAQPTGRREPEPWETVVEDPVDVYWRSQDGKIQRQRDPNFCRHGSNAMCDYCMPLEPYEPKYHAENKIKHLSFHAYLRKLTPPASSNSSSALLPPLSPISYVVANPCPRGQHPPWPGGICSACQPSAITLQQQPYRTVDHLELASPEIVDVFLRAWRATGRQRFGWMVGRWAPHELVPMGIKAVVEAIVEPPQEGDVDGLTIGEGHVWDVEDRVKELASYCGIPGGLKVIGMIWTDLTPNIDDRAKSICKRHAGSYFLSAQETLFAAAVQQKHPLSTRASPTGAFGSRFVTAVLSADKDGAVAIEAYMASEQATAMVEADMVEASVDPGVVRVKEEGPGRYIPEVFYRYRNEYGRDVQKSARPSFPVEYLLINVTHGFPINPSPVFRSNSFAVENRPLLESQEFSTVMRDLHQLGATDLRESTTVYKVMNYLSDFHLLLFLPSIGILGEREFKNLVKAVTAPDDQRLKLMEGVMNSSGWQTLMAIVQENAPSAKPTGSGPRADSPFEIPPELRDEPMHDAGGTGGRRCPHCTFDNLPGATDCEVCCLPLSG
ncbi:Nuclear protein localization protein 4 [Ceratobasidium theobromae]|uniref:Nuclear protein localization protein 4 n=1 Tax=Ceratobasidium theobromae TaxID=1582974 RepID=A0A5N5QUR4_9AGAM|nr:Nuclear protein localization protein 4 [Ceratobasidium theobromae]